VAEVAATLRERLELAREAGIETERIVLDPGIGFGKTPLHNLQLIGRLSELACDGRPILLGVSRKAFLGRIIGGAPPEKRTVATVAACVVGMLNGARIFRVHDVAEVREALDVTEAIRNSSFTG
jgi:dihydropteroate synthase